MIFRFGLFELNTDAEQLLKTGLTVRLQPQPYRLLCLLTSQTGKVVTRDDIRTTLWTDETFVDYEQGVNFAMKQVREALDDDADNPVYIQTIPKRGYRFVQHGNAPPRESASSCRSESRRPSAAGCRCGLRRSAP